MNLYIFRHGEAVPEAKELPDEWRFLTREGRDATGKVARKMSSHCRMPRLIVSSPLVRAVQTAQLVAEHCGAKCTVSVSGLLRPGSDLKRLKSALLVLADQRRVMVVGHEPLLGQLAGLFMGTPAFELKKSGCIALKIDPEQPDQPARFLFYLAPGKRPSRTPKPH